MLVGEIGIERREFLYELNYWEIILIIRGYNRRHRDLWSAVRWHAYNVMSAMPYCKLAESGIYKPTDLMTFPWEVEHHEAPSEEEKEEMTRLAQMYGMDIDDNG